METRTIELTVEELEMVIGGLASEINFRLNWGFSVDGLDELQEKLERML